jgi:acetyl esterase
MYIPPMTQVDPQARALLERWAATPGVPVERLTATNVRQEDLAVLDLQATPDRLHAVDDIEVPGAAGAMAARVYRPRAGRLQAVLYLHGGGFVIGPEGYDAPLRQLALSSGNLIVALRHRLAPEHRFPAALEDAVAGANWLAGNVEALGGLNVPLGVVGDSSGGNLAAVAVRTLTREGAPLAFQVLIYPMLDATASSASYVEFASGYGFSREKSLWYFDHYLPPEVDRRAPRVSPLFEPDLAGLPPTLIVTAECDPLRDEGEAYAQNLRDGGVEVDVRRYRGMIHGFFQMTGALESSRRLHRELGDWMREAADKARRVTVGDNRDPGGGKR